MEPGEEIVLFRAGSTGLTTDTTTWGIVITTPASHQADPLRAPGNGDVLLIATRRPFPASDRFTITTAGSTVSTERAFFLMDQIYVVPNPYVGLSDIEPTNRLPGADAG